jgi:macrolide transport system ATP-binding/permease protein
MTQSTTQQIVTRLTEAASNEIRVSSTTDVDDPFILDPDSPTAAPALVKQLDGVAVAVPVRTFAAVGNLITRVRVQAGIGQATTDTYGGRLFVTDLEYLTSYGRSAASGRMELISPAWDAPGVVMGSEAAGKLGVAEAAPGVAIWVNDRPVDVLAILNPTGDVLADDALYFSRGTLPILSNRVDAYLLVRTEKGYAEPLAAAIPMALAPDNPGSISVSTVSQLAQLQRGINSDLSNLLSVVGWVIVVLSALTAGTAMFLSVQHRAPEIALRRAMGASRLAIWRLFTYEGVAIGVAGGITGTAAGIALCWVVAQANDWPVSLGARVPSLGFAVGLLAGMAASAIPALYASHRDPAGILRTV